ncbi:MAG: hypothetical protein U5J83_13120 [Bryobacterales bacterium]|nr:hypothetical protein [Bryobacterales bacterium]
MRTMIGFCSIAALALLFATGCDRNDRAEVNDAAREAGRETSEAMKEVGQEASEAWNDLKNATWDRRVGVPGAPGQPRRCNKAERADGRS